MAYIGNSPLNSAFPLDTFTGDGTTVAYTMSFAPASTNSMVVSVDGVKQAVTTYGINGYTLTFSEAPPASSTIEILFLGIPASGVTNTAYRTETEFTATSGQTTFNVPSYTPGFISVFQNGIKLGSEDFTANNGVTVVLALGATTGDFIEVESFFVSSINNAVSQNGGSFSGNVQFPKGTAAAPSLFFNEATTSGFYSNVNTVGISTNGNSAIFIDSSQRVGIGTVTPTQKLHVIGNQIVDGKIITGDSLNSANIANVLNLSTLTGPAAFRPINLIDTSATIKVARVNNTAGGAVELFQWDSTITSLLSYGMIAGENGNLLIRQLMAGAGNIIFQNGGSAFERMRIDINGNVGIGTSSPAVLLDVNRTGGQLRVSDGTVDMRMLPLAASSVGIAGTLSNHAYVLYTNNVERMRITPGGEVGIGTTNPTAQLQINRSGTGDYTTIRLSNSGASGRIYEIGLGGNTAASGYANSLYFYDSTAGALRAAIDSSGNLQFNSGYGSSATAYGCRAWVCFRGDGTVAIQGAGNVSSITDIGLGSYAVNFSTAMVDTNYACVMGQQRAGTSDFINEGFNRGTNSTRVETFANGSGADFPRVQLAFFR